MTSLTFHHVNPLKKEFDISGKSISWERLKKELDKCVLVCRNCHGEIEAGIINFDGPYAGVIGKAFDAAF